MSLAGAIMGLPLAIAASNMSAPAPTTFALNLDGYTAVANQQLDAIATYARWPDDRRTLRTCIVGQTDLANTVTTHNLPNGRTIVPIRSLPARTNAANCDIAILGQMSAADRAQIVRAANQQPLLTITDADPSCNFGTMFCWRVSNNALTFDLNIGAVTRSRVRVDPRVLALGRRAGAD